MNNEEITGLEYVAECKSVSRTVKKDGEVAWVATLSVKGTITIKILTDSATLFVPGRFYVTSVDPKEFEPSDA